MTPPLRRSRPHLRRLAGRSALAGLTALAASLVPSLASAQSGFVANRFDPSEKGSDWFANESLDYRGNFRPAIGIIGDYSKDDVVIRNPDGSSAGSLIQDAYYLHLGGSITMFHRLRLGANIPLELGQSGNDVGLGGTGFRAPEAASIGDIRLGGDVRLLGEYQSPFTLAVGAQAYLPTGSTTQLSGAGSARVTPRFMLAGDVDVFTYAFRMGFEFRPDDNFQGHPIGNELSWGAAVGIRLLDKKLLVGPEFQVNTLASNAFQSQSTPSEFLVGAHYRIKDWQVGGSVGTGFDAGDSIGSPTLRILLGVEWHPAIAEPPAPADRDHDGVNDAEDACPDVPGVRTSDPKTNGCPPDRDHDGVPDADDACPDVPGLKTSDPKTNGCPPAPPPDPDRDKDGIPNEADACPDAAGPANADPKKNGCPLARVEAGQIKISEQVKFAENSARLLKDSDNLLNAVLEIVNGHPEITQLKIEGYTDSKGAAAYNKTLSAQRAASVRGWLVLHKVDPKRLESAGYGADRPIDTNDTEAGRQNNRRVEFHIGDKAPDAPKDAPPGALKDAPKPAAPAAATPPPAAH